MKNTFAYIGLAGALGMAVCDVILLGQPVSGSYYDLSSFGAMEHISPTRAAIGAGGGLFCSFFICLGYWHFKTLFEQVNSRRATLLFISLASVMFFGGAFHAGYYFLAGLPGNPHPPYLEALSWLGVPGFIASTIFFYLLAGNQRFPRWYRLCNPLLLMAVFLLAFYILPAPVGGYLRPTFMNMGTAAFFLFSLLAQPSHSQSIS